MKTWIIVSLIVAASFIAAWFVIPDESRFKQASFYQQVSSPGSLSAAHAHLENNCAACHTPVVGVDSTKCISCHANNESILQRQPTTFHASISSCKQCHLEHQGIARHPTQMDHEALVKIGMAALDSGDSGEENSAIRNELSAWANRSAVPHANISATENLLNCASCHSNDDRHFKLFGSDCASCHATDRWTIPEFRHPSSNSHDCAQCHQAPPSHYMMHFKMISATVAGKPHARVDQCFECHQTTSWNDIKNAGWYKHH